jgi:hypothetical protein
MRNANILSLAAVQITFSAKTRVVRVLAMYMMSILAVKAFPTKSNAGNSDLIANL